MILCGNTCGHNHESINGPTGCCEEHGPYMYFCNTCHEEYSRAHHGIRRDLGCAMANLTDVKLRVNRRKKKGHFWNGTSFTNDGYPVALCGDLLYPRDPMYFMTTKEMKGVPFCQKCLSMIER